MGNTPLHYAVANQSIRMVKLLDEFGAKGTLRNEDDICAIDMAITEDLKDIKLYFVGQPKYKTFDFSGMNNLGKRPNEDKE